MSKNSAPWSLPDNATKRQELKTYSAMGLKRTLKSRSQRRRLLARGAQIILGNGDPGSPEIMVRRDLYTQIRLTVLSEHLTKVKRGGLLIRREALLDHLTPSIERETYRRLLLQKLQGGRLEEAFMKTHSRKPTSQEQNFFANRHQTECSAQDTASQNRQDILGEVLGSIEEARQNSSGRLQTGWAEVVGCECAQQTHLEKVEAGIAWFRCLNSALSYQLSRKPELPARLAKALGLPIRQLRVSY